MSATGRSAMEGARAQRTGRAHLRVPVDDMIFEIAKRPAGQISVRKAFFVSFCALQKVTRSARDWHRKTAMDGLQERQARATRQNDKPKQKPKKSPQTAGFPNQILPFQGTSHPSSNRIPISIRNPITPIRIIPTITISVS